MHLKCVVVFVAVVKCYSLMLLWRFYFCRLHTVHSEGIQKPHAKIISIHFSPSSIYTQYPIMTKWKPDFTLKQHTDISIQTLYSVLPWNNFGSLESSCIWHDKVCTPGSGDFLPFCRSSQAPSGLMGLPFSGLFRNVQLGSRQGSGWVTRGSKALWLCPFVPVVSWLCP